MEINIKKNLGYVVNSLQNRNMKLTNIAREMGFTTTTQLHNALSGSSLLSTKAIIGLIENLDVNPNFLFLGKGEMFITDESELDSLQQQYRELELKHGKLGDQAIDCAKKLFIAEDRYNRLIDITSAALENTRNKQVTEQKNSSEENSK